jgi:hypothetical protein
MDASGMLSCRSAYQVQGNTKEFDRNRRNIEIHENPKKSIGSGHKSIMKPMELDANPKKSIRKWQQINRKSIWNWMQIHRNPKKSIGNHRNP